MKTYNKTISASIETIIVLAATARTGTIIFLQSLWLSLIQKFYERGSMYSLLTVTKGIPHSRDLLYTILDSNEGIMKDLAEMQHIHIFEHGEKNVCEMTCYNSE